MWVEQGTWKQDYLPCPTGLSGSDLLPTLMRLAGSVVTRGLHAQPERVPSFEQQEYGVPGGGFHT